MGTEHNGKHFAVECKVDGVWFADDFAFPTRAEALVFKQREESCGSGNPRRIVSTSAPVNLPPEEEEGEGEEEGEDGSSNGDGPSSSFDWAVLFEVSVLCPISFHGAGDGDLDLVYSRCRQGCCVVDKVFF